MKDKRIIIILITILIIILVTVTVVFLQNNNKNPETPDTTSTTTKVNNNQLEVPLTDEEVLESLSIYADSDYEFIITEESETSRTVEKRNITTGEVDMIFKVDITTGNYQLEKVKPKTSLGGGGGLE